MQYHNNHNSLTHYHQTRGYCALQQRHNYFRHAYVNNKTKYDIHIIMQTSRRDTGHSFYTSRFHFSRAHSFINNILYRWT